VSKAKSETVQKWIAGHKRWAIDNPPLEVVPVEVRISEKLVTVTSTDDRKTDPNRPAKEILRHQQYGHQALGKIFFDTPEEAIEEHIASVVSAIKQNGREGNQLQRELVSAHKLLAKHKEPLGQ
jgi:hypothetical protein